MEQLIGEFTTKLSEGLISGGWPAVIGVVLMFVLRIYLLPGVQRIVPERARWDRFTPLARFLLPFGLMFCGALVFAIATKVAIATAIGTALGAAIIEAIAHAGTKAAAKTIDEAALEANPMYSPGALRNGATRIGLMPPFKPPQQ